MANNKSLKWSDVEMEALLQLWADDTIQESLNTMVHNKDIYDKIVAQMAELGFQRNTEQCQNKPKALHKKFQSTQTLRKKFQSTQTHNQKSGVQAKSFVGYDIMRDVLCNRELVHLPTS